MKVLYEDNHLIAVYKPTGVLVQKGDTEGHDDNTLYWQVKEFIKKRDQKPGNVFLGVLHRLDRPTSGIVLFAKTSKGAARLSEQFRNREIKKTYHAVVYGKLDLSEATLKDFMQKDSSSLKAIIGPLRREASGPEISTELADDPSRRGVDEVEAILHYQVVQSSNSYSLLKIKLETGRFHQIRAQLSAIGHPIVGDVKYGAPEQLPDHSIALCATSLKFKTATGDEEHEISIEIPKDWHIYFS